MPADEAMDLAWRTEGVQYAVWAVGRLDALAEPAYHRLYPRADVALRLAAAPPANDCFDFVMYVSRAPRPAPPSRAHAS